MRAGGSAGSAGDTELCGGHIEGGEIEGIVEAPQRQVFGRPEPGLSGGDRLERQGDRGQGDGDGQGKVTADLVDRGH